MNKTIIKYYTYFVHLLATVKDSYVTLPSARVFGNL